jgi:ATP adenylyltransferase
MPHYRNHKNQKLYAAHTKKARTSSTCQFCALQKGDDEVVEVHKHFKILRNIFPYNNWDARGVSDHLMIVPLQHTENLSTLGDAAAVEFVKLLSAYEQDGYNIYARSPKSLMKSVPHQHTHLIKNDGKRHKAVIHFEKPYISITF